MDDVHMKVSIYTASLEIVHAHRVRPVTGLLAPIKQHLVVYWPVLISMGSYKMRNAKVRKCEK